MAHLRRNSHVTYAIRYVSSNWFIYVRRPSKRRERKKEDKKRHFAKREEQAGRHPYTGFSSQISRRNRELRQIRTRDTRAAPYFSRSWIERLLSGARDFAPFWAKVKCQRTWSGPATSVLRTVRASGSYAVRSFTVRVTPRERLVPRNEIAIFSAGRHWLARETVAGSRFPGAWISRVSYGFRSDGASCFLPFQVRQTPLVRSLNHGLTYLFPRAISAVVLRENNNRFREQYRSRSTYDVPVHTSELGNARQRDRRRSAKAAEGIISPTEYRLPRAWQHAYDSHFEKMRAIPRRTSRPRQAATATGQSGLIGGLIIYEACFIHSLKFPGASARDHYDVIMS